MNPNSKLRRLWCGFLFDPFVAPLAAPWAVFSPALILTRSALLYVLLLLWSVLLALLEHMAPYGWPKSRARRLTPNFFAVRDINGCWRVFQCRPKGKEDCQTLLRELLSDRRRLPGALTPGSYRALTHDTILCRLRRMPNVDICSCTPVYVATLEDTVSMAVRGRCRHCKERCPFPGLKKPRTFYDVCFQVS